MSDRPGVSLRPFQPGDAPAVHRWFNNPAATARFVTEFLTAAPANKLLTFGGDYVIVEPVVGHAAIARRGLAQALDNLVDDGWLDAEAALALVDPLMHGNAEALFSRT